MNKDDLFALVRSFVRSFVVRSFSNGRHEINISREEEFVEIV